MAYLNIREFGAAGDGVHDDTDVYKRQPMGKPTTANPKRSSSSRMLSPFLTPRTVSYTHLTNFNLERGVTENTLR